MSFTIQVSNPSGHVVASTEWVTGRSRRTNEELRAAHTVRLPDGDAPRDEDDEEDEEKDVKSRVLPPSRGEEYPAMLGSPASGGPHNELITELYQKLQVNRCLCDDSESHLCPHQMFDLSYMDRPSPPPSPRAVASPRAASPVPMEL